MTPEKAPPVMADSSKQHRRPLLHSLASTIHAIATGRHAWSIAVPVALWVFDAVLCALIIWKIPYTEIDWRAYMQQVAQVRAGERDYPAIKGATGPLVYPAAHVYTYAALHAATDHGRDVARAQLLFAGVYLAALAAALASYVRAGAPPWLLPLLVLSKRMHSVFVLRCFNDGVAALCLWGAVLLLQRRRWTAAALVFTWGVGVKMVLLLALPAVGVVLVQGRGVAGAVRLAWLMVQVQIVTGLPFLARNPAGYLGRAFELSRQFKYEWTVNWRMVSEPVFLSKRFSAVLLLLHVATLAAFVGYRWLAPPATVPRVAAAVAALVVPGSTVRGSHQQQQLQAQQSPSVLRGFTPSEERTMARRVTADYILTTVLTANVVGLLFARSLHYQFYAYLAWSTPFLVWRAQPGRPWLALLLWAAQEWAWNVFPSTSVSSTVAVGVMAATVALVWFAGGGDDVRPKAE